MKLHISTWTAAIFATILCIAATLLIAPAIPILGLVVVASFSFFTSLYFYSEVVDLKELGYYLLTIAIRLLLKSPLRKWGIVGGHILQDDREGPFLVWHTKTSKDGIIMLYNNKYYHIYLKIG